jgi:hypothetical protein
MSRAMMELERLMNSLRQSISIALLSAVVLSPRVSAAMEIPQFDMMAEEDQQHYLAFLVKEAQKLLIEQGRRDLAVKVSLLFQTVPAGETRSVGEAQFQVHLAAARPWSTRINFEVESVLFTTLQKNGITLPASFYKRLPELTRNRVFYQSPK